MLFIRRNKCYLLEETEFHETFYAPFQINVFMFDKLMIRNYLSTYLCLVIFSYIVPILVRH